MFVKFVEKHFALEMLFMATNIGISIEVLSMKYS